MMILIMIDEHVNTKRSANKTLLEITQTKQSTEDFGRDLANISTAVPS